MNWFKNRKAVTKLMLGFGLMALLLAFVAYRGLSSASQINNRLETLYQRDLMGLSAVKEANINLVYIGRSIRAVHQNAHSAALMGIDVSRVQTLTFALGIGILAIAAALLLPGTPIQPAQGLRYTVITLIVVALGGMTNFVGIMLGGLIIGLSEAYGTIYLSDTLGMLLPYGIFVLIMLFRPQGLTWSSSR